MDFGFEGLEALGVIVAACEARQFCADLARMRLNRILIDGSDEEGLLLQIFTQDTFGPIFFEIIQRKGNQAFGEGNSQALFDSIELDQIRRGVIKVDA